MNLFKTRIFSIFSMALLVTGFVACSSDDSNTVNEENDILSSNSKQLSIGEIHNELLTYTFEEYPFPENFDSLDERLINLASFQSNYLGNYNNELTDMAYAQSNMIDVREFYLTENSMNMFLNGIEFNKEQWSLEQINQYLYENGAISNFDKVVVDGILLSLRENLNGNLSTDNLYNELVNHKKNWIDSQSHFSNKGGEFSYIILDIGINSLEWWDKNPYTPGMQTNAVPVWIATDIVGAVGGAAFAAISQHVFNDGKINWTIVAAAGLTTAITASTGVWGKIGKWLVRGKI